jgi:hypothetical protein
VDGKLACEAILTCMMVPRAPAKAGAAQEAGAAE